MAKKFWVMPLVFVVLIIMALVLMNVQGEGSFTYSIF
jgi:hypothetical protein